MNFYDLIEEGARIESERARAEHECAHAETEERINDLIKEGIRIHAERLAAERRREQEEYERVERARAEATERILALLPEPLRAMAKLKMPDYTPFSHVTVRIELPRGGHVSVIVRKNTDGEWQFTTRFEDPLKRLFEAQNSQGRYARFETVEEAVAFAAGKIDP